MGKINLVCPSCQARLSFNEVPGYLDKMIQCPKCHYKAKTSVYLRGSASSGGYGASEDATEVQKTGGNYDVGQIRVEGETCVHPLSVGSNIIGRIAKSGTADIQITHDEYMSRRHLQIDVVRTSHGYEHHLVEINSKNIVLLDGRKIERGDVLKLKFGARLVLGRTTVIFEESSDEGTKME